MLQVRDCQRTHEHVRASNLDRSGVRTKTLVSVLMSELMSVLTSVLVSALWPGLARKAPATPLPD